MELLVDALLWIPRLSAVGAHCDDFSQVITLLHGGRVPWAIIPSTAHPVVGNYIIRVASDMALSFSAKLKQTGNIWRVINTELQMAVFVCCVIHSFISHIVFGLVFVAPQQGGDGSQKHIWFWEHYEKI